jgi:hypothetical protein
MNLFILVFMIVWYNYYEIKKNIVQNSLLIIQIL